MDWEGWIFTAALVFCLFAMVRCESTGKEIECDVYHENMPVDMCETYE